MKLICNRCESDKNLQECEIFDGNGRKVWIENQILCEDCRVDLRNNKFRIFKVEEVKG